jgi:hypothetical protein
VVIWYIFLRFGILRQEKSGNPAVFSCVFDTRKCIKQQIALQLILTRNIEQEICVKNRTMIFGTNYPNLPKCSLAQIAQICPNVLWLKLPYAKVSASNSQIPQRTCNLPGLPDFCWSKVPKRGKIYQITTKYTKLPQNIPNGHKIFLIAV